MLAHFKRFPSNSASMIPADKNHTSYKQDPYLLQSSTLKNISLPKQSQHGYTRKREKRIKGGSINF